MNTLEAINLRRSHRTYLDTPIEKEKLEMLNVLINQCNEEGDISFSLVEDGSDAFNSMRKSYGLLKGVRTIILLKGKKEDIHLKEKVGYYGEKVVLEATKLGLGTCWVGGSFDRKSEAVHVLDEEALICVIPIGYVPEKKPLKEQLIYKLVHRKTKTIEELSKGTSFMPTWFIEGMKAVQKAPSAMNAQPAIFIYKDGLVSAFVDESKEFTLVDLGIAKYHFEAATHLVFQRGNHGKCKKQ